MKLRLGQPVHSTDGPFGVLAEIVVNPAHKKVSHIIVEPALGYYQSRLVPIWLVEDSDSTITVQLDEAHLRQLQRVGYSDFVRHDGAVEIEGAWDVVAEETVSFATNNADDDLPDLIDLTDGYQRIPPGECEIQITSKVISSDGFSVGTVHGFLADDSDKLSAVIVRVGVPGIRHDVLVPFTDIARVLHRRIELEIDQHQFFALPHTGTLSDADTPATTSHRIKRRLQTTAARAAVRGERLTERINERLMSAMHQK